MNTFRDTEPDASLMFGVEGAYIQPPQQVVRVLHRDGSERLLTTTPGEFDRLALIETDPWARSPAPRVPREREQPSGSQRGAFWIALAAVGAALAWGWFA